MENVNALRLDWNTVVSNKGNETETTLYILGDPPFVGKQFRNEAQNADMAIACADIKSNGTLDYVTAWYIKAVEFIQRTRIKAAFVSTNSITQGEQVGILWSYLIERGVKIHFAHRTFKWNNEARGQAAVHCVIIGFATFDVASKRLFDHETPVADPHEIEAKNINPYLIDSTDLIIQSRRTPLSNVPSIVFGNMANDGGHLLLTDEEKKELLKAEPEAEPFLRRIYGSEEFINGSVRWCLWLIGVHPQELRSMPSVLDRVEQVRSYRLASRRETTRKFQRFLPFR